MMSFSFLFGRSDQWIEYDSPRDTPEHYWNVLLHKNCTYNRNRVTRSIINFLLQSLLERKFVIQQVASRSILLLRNINRPYARVRSDGNRRILHLRLKNWFILLCWKGVPAESAHQREGRKRRKAQAETLTPTISCAQTGTISANQ